MTPQADSLNNATANTAVTLPTSSTAFLHGLRGLAAVYVMLGHARWLLWEGFTEGFAKHPEQYSLLGKLGAYASLVLYYGHQAVIFFFVLSGFVIHLRYAKALQQAANPTTVKFDYVPYLWRRWRRIYPLFLFAIIATFLIDQVGIAQRYTIYSQTTPYGLINLNVATDFTIKTAFSNLLLIPDAATWGSNGPLWSLRFEWGFYLLYPALWLLIRRSLAWTTALIGGLFALSFVLPLWPLATLRIVFAAFPAWWMGALLAEIYVGRIRIPFARVAWLAALFVGLPFAVAPIVQLEPFLQDFLWALGFTGLLAACFAWQNRFGALAFLGRLHFLGTISYSLYVLHFPILVLLSGWLMQQSTTGTLPQHFTWIFVGAAICAVVAYAAHRFIERPFALGNAPSTASQ